MIDYAALARLIVLGFLVIYLIYNAGVVLLPPKPSTPSRWVVCYRAPQAEHWVYLACDQNMNDKTFWFYTNVFAKAHRFDTWEEAMQAIPVYDGSMDIVKRTKIVEVT